MATRQEIVREAMTWIGVPFLHQGRFKYGADCVGMIIGTLNALGIEEEVQNVGPKFYPKRVNGWRLEEHMSSVMDRIDRADMKPADVLLLLWRKYPQHVAMVGEKHAGIDTIIHSAEHLKKVTHHSLDKEWGGRIVGCFRFRSLSDG